MSATLTRAERLLAALQCAVKRTNANTNAPWEIVHPQYGSVRGPLRTIFHPNLGHVAIADYYFSSKREAEGALALGIAQLSTDDPQELARLIGPAVYVPLTG